MRIELNEKDLERRKDYLKTQKEYYACVDSESSTELERQAKRREYFWRAISFCITIDSAIEAEETCDTKATT